MSAFYPGQIVFHAVHSEGTDLTASGAEVRALQVMDDSGHSLVCREIATAQIWRFCKWPRRYFGDALNGPFSTRQKAVQKSAAALPCFDSLGNRL